MQIFKFVKSILFKYILNFILFALEYVYYGQQLNPHDFSLLPLSYGIARMYKDGKKPYESRKRQFNTWSKICTCKAKQRKAKHSLNTFHQKINQPMGGGALAFIKLVWGDKSCNHHLSFRFCLMFYCWAWHDKEYWLTGLTILIIQDWHESVWVSCSGCVLPTSAQPQPPLWVDRVGNRKSLDNVQALLSNGWNTGVLLRWCSHMSKAWHRMGC